MKPATPLPWRAVEDNDSSPGGNQCQLASQRIAENHNNSASHALS